jgi:hypothetical protein
MCGRFSVSFNLRDNKDSVESLARRTAAALQYCAFTRGAVIVRNADHNEVRWSCANDTVGLLACQIAL